MSRLSGIPHSVNKYAIEWAYKIRNKEIELAKGIDFKYKKVSKESQLINGLASGVPYNPTTDPSHIFVHNHPLGSDLSIIDVMIAVKTNIKKIFASTKQGYTAIDFTTVKKSVSKKEIKDWLADNYIAFLKTKTTKWYEEISPEELKRQQEWIHKTLKEFAKFSGATMSDVKWSDYKQLRR